MVTVLTLTLLTLIVLLMVLVITRKLSAGANGNTPAHANILDDALASQRMLAHLLNSNDITREQYEELHSIITKRVSQWQQSTDTPPPQSLIELSADKVTDLRGPVPAPAAPAPVAPEQVLSQEIVFADVIDHQSTAQNVPPLIRATEPTVVSPVSGESKPPITQPARVTPAAPLFQNGGQERLGKAEPNVGVSETGGSRPPALKEILEAFMREKNIRWGELVSGILIIGSAVGLVISLRDQLREQIPYFSALLFLLITSAVHASGIYTLRRWKLRDTSRGVLIIGLLLIPLNFFAACTLSERRGLTDPIFWGAIAIGLVCFSVMVAAAGRAILRRGWWPLWIAVIGSGACQLWLNRMIEPGMSSQQLLTLTAPVLICVLLASLGGRAKIWRQQPVSGQTSFRLLLVSGVATFAFITTFSLVVFRSGTLVPTLANLTPWLSVMSISLAWLGWVLFHTVSGRRSNFYSTVGGTLAVLGALLCVGATLYAWRVPNVLVLTGVLNFVLLFCLSRRKSLQGVTALAWICASAAAVAFVGHLTGDYQLGEPAGWSQHREVFLSAFTPYCLLAVGLLAAIIHYRLPIESGHAILAGSHQTVGLITGGGLVATAGLLAVIISLVRPEDALNMHSATIILILAQIAIAVLSLRLSNNFWPHVSAIWLTITLAHAFYWNPVGEQWCISVTQGIDCRWGLIAALVGLSSASSLKLIRLRLAGGSEATLQRERSEGFALWALAGAFGALIAGMWTIAYLTGLAFGFTLIAAITCWLVAESMREKGYTWTFGLVATFCVVFFAVEFSRLFGLAGADDLTGVWWAIVIALGLWSAVWKLIAISATTQPSSRLKWVVGDWPRFDHFSDLIALVIATLFVILMLSPGVLLELSQRGLGGAVGAEWESGLWVQRTLALTCLGLVLAISILEHPKKAPWLGVVVWWTIAFIAFGYGFDATRSAASAVRWLSAISGTALAVLIACRSMYRSAWHRWRQRLGLSGSSSLSERQMIRLTNMSLSVVIGIVLALTSIVLIYVMFGGKMNGPAPNSFFGVMPMEISYAMPVVLIVFTLLLYAIRETRVFLATVGSGVFQYFVLLALVLLFLSPHPVFASQWFARILQVGAMGMSIYGLAWWWFEDRIVGKSIDKNRTRYLEIHTSLNLVLAFSMPMYSILTFLSSPLEPTTMTRAAGAPVAYASLIGIGILAGLVWKEKLKFQTWWVSVLGCAVVSTIASSIQSLDKVNGCSLLVIGLCAISILACAMASRERRDDGWGYLASTAPVFVPVGLLLAVAVRIHLVEAISPWLSIVPLAVVSLAFLVLGVRHKSSYLAVVATVLSVVSVSLFHDSDGISWARGIEIPLWQWWILVVLAIGVVWNAAYVLSGKLPKEKYRWDNPAEFTDLVAVIGTASLVWIGAAKVTLGAESFSGSWTGGWGTLLLFATFSSISWWNAHFKAIATHAYIGLLGSILWIDLPHVLPADQTALKLLVIGASVALASLFWWQREMLGVLGAKLRVPRRRAIADNIERAWPVIGITVALAVLIPCGNLVIISGSLATAFVCVCPLLIAIGLTPFADTRWRFDFKWLILSLATYGALLISWSIARQAQPLTFGLELLVRSYLGLASVAMIVSLLQTRGAFIKDWSDAIKKWSAISCTVSMTLLAAIVALQLNQFDPVAGAGPPPVLACLVSSVGLVLVGSLVGFATWREFDPLNLSGRMKQVYVYGAELFLLLVCLQLFLAMPWLFQFGVKDYWPIFASGVAFVGVGLAEVAKQRRFDVLAEPLFNTAVATPIVTALAFWSIPSKADPAIVMMIGGLFYVFVAYIRESTVSGLIAFAFGNLALWLFYGKFPDLAFAQHPQLWLIPPAVSALIASQINRSRLDQSQLVTIRYVSMAVVYISSTSEIFLNGIAEHVWPPMVLSLLAVLGILLGMALRIRAFLYFGIVFLLVSVIAMVSHAHHRLDHIWPWWAFGIGLGAAILVLFGLFENKKNQLASIAHKLGQWDY